MGFFAQAGYEWRNFAFGKYKAELSISYGQKGEKSDETIVFFVVPWHLLSIIIISLLILFFFFRRFIRSYNRFIIRQATMALEQMEEMKDHRQAERSQPLAKRSYEEQPETLDLRAKKTPRRKI
jgi:flagellar biosynthesis/type III secretory pathway M-ring protein FliF/YscJ